MEKFLLEKMEEKYPGWDVVDEPAFENKSYLLELGLIVLNNPVLGRVKKNKQIRKFEASIMPNYCPFCGMKLKSE